MNQQTERLPVRPPTLGEWLERAAEHLARAHALRSRGEQEPARFAENLAIRMFGLSHEVLCEAEEAGLP